MRPGAALMKGTSEPAAATTAPGPDAARVRSVRRNEAGQLVVEMEGRAEPVVDARAARCFPRRFPEGYVSLRDKDGRELALFRTLEGVDPDLRARIEEELHDKVFTPRILRILDKKDEFGVVSLTADTDRGRVTFQVRSRDDIHHLAASHLLFRDADGNAYEVRDIAALDRPSRRFLREYV
jgi:hypothetical protein